MTWPFRQSGDVTHLWFTVPNAHLLGGGDKAGNGTDIRQRDDALIGELGGNSGPTQQRFGGGGRGSAG